MNKEKIGFFGGCFNPITVAHINLIKKAINECNLDKVFFIPMGDYYKKDELISADERYKMLCLALQEESKMFASRLVIDLNKPTNAIDTFEIIESRYNNSENYFIMGSDNFNQIKSWVSSDKLEKNYKYIILNRGNTNNCEHQIVKDNIMENISSSLVRNKIKNNESIEQLVPPKVEEYILKNKLYK